MFWDHFKKKYADFSFFLSFSMTYKFIKLQYMGSNLENFSHNLPLLFFF